MNGVSESPFRGHPARRAPYTLVNILASYARNEIKRANALRPGASSVHVMMMTVMNQNYPRIDESCTDRRCNHY